jgi:amino acid adenylation domain-containing protein
MLTLIHRKFEALVERQPHARALIFEGKVMTYEELNRKANQIAHFLRSHGVGIEDGKKLVGLGTDRSMEMIVGMYGILKAGGAYVPIDPAHPDERLAYILDNTKVNFILTQKVLVSRWERVLEGSTDLNLGSITPIGLDSEEDVQWSDFPDTNPDWDVPKLDLAYIIYTSGTTGKPKGVMICHETFNNYVTSAEVFFPIRPDDICLQRSSMAFDVSIIDIHSVLTIGGCCVICSSSDQKDVMAMLTLVETYQATVIAVTPSLLSAFLIQRDASRIMHTLRMFYVCGEAVERSLVQMFHKVLPHSEFYNAYGPTETAVTITCCLIDPHREEVVVGTPIEKVTIYILDDKKVIVPEGAPGELYIGGANLGLGYLNRPELTAQAFIWHRFYPDSEPLRLYKTGDIVKQLPDGNLVYIGRADNQVKIRGYRIELEEVEARLLSVPGIIRAATIVKGEGMYKYLVCFLTREADSTEEDKVFIESIRTTLRQSLPEYMIPSYFQIIGIMPLNVNGKKIESY